MSYSPSNLKVKKKKTKCESKIGATRYGVMVQKTNLHIVAILYDAVLKTEVSAVSTRAKVTPKFKTKMESATWIGEQIAVKCKEHNITNVYFNKLNYKFHGIIASVVDSIKKSGIIV